MRKELSKDEKRLYDEIRQLIEEARTKVSKTFNSEMTMLFWSVGKKINGEILQNKRAEYGKETVSKLSHKLTTNYGKSFVLRNLRRMMQFAEQFSDLEIVSTLSTQLSWSHFIELLPVKESEKRYFYANKIAEENWTIRHTRKQIEQKVFERSQIANEQLPKTIKETHNTFKDPYFLDFLGLQEGYLENDLENAILKELELFILELGAGFSFIERQKRMIIDGQDFYLDLLFLSQTITKVSSN